MTEKEIEIEKRSKIRENFGNRTALVHKMQDLYPKILITYHMAKHNEFPREFIEIRKGKRIWRLNTDQYNEEYIVDNVMQCIRTKDCALLYEEE